MKKTLSILFGLRTLGFVSMSLASDESHLIFKEANKHYIAPPPGFEHLVKRPGAQKKTCEGSPQTSSSYSLSSVLESKETLAERTAPVSLASLFTDLLPPDKSIEIKDFDVLFNSAASKFNIKLSEVPTSLSLQELVNTLYKLPRKKDVRALFHSYLTEINDCLSSYVHKKTKLMPFRSFFLLFKKIATLQSENVIFSKFFREFLCHNRSFMANMAAITSLYLKGIKTQKARAKKNLLADYTAYLHYFYQIGFGMPPKYLRQWDAQIISKLSLLNNFDFFDLLFSHGKLNIAMEPAFLKAWYMLSIDRFTTKPNFDPKLLINAIYAHGLLNIKPHPTWLDKVYEFFQTLPKEYEVNDRIAARELIWAKHFLIMNQLPPLTIAPSDNAIGKLQTEPPIISQLHLNVRNRLKIIVKKSFNLYRPQIKTEEYLPKLASRADGVIYAQTYSPTKGPVLQNIIVFEADGLPHMYGNQLNTVTLLRNRIYNHLGYILIVIPYYEWDNLHTNEAKDSYLRAKYFEAMKKKRRETQKI